VTSSCGLHTEFTVEELQDQSLGSAPASPMFTMCQDMTPLVASLTCVTTLSLTSQPFASVVMAFQRVRSHQSEQLFAVSTLTPPARGDIYSESRIRRTVRIYVPRLTPGQWTTEWPAEPVVYVPVLVTSASVHVWPFTE